MKALLTWLLLFCSAVFCEAQTYTSSCVPAGTMESTYRNDACRLAIKRMHEIATPFADSVSIPENYIDSIQRALYAVDNIQNALVDDTLRGIFGRSDFFPYSDSTHFVSASNDFNDAFSLKQVKVIVDNNTSWGAQWLSGNYDSTSNDAVNYLVNKHYLVVTPSDPQSYPGKTSYLMSAPQAINAGALARLFESISGVGTGNAYEVRPFPAGSGNTIRLVFVGNDIKLTYSFGCGDCPAGCTLGRRWNFNVRADCAVDYLSVENWGDPLSWISEPCLDYTQTSTICPQAASTVLYTNYSNGGNYQWQMSTDGVTFSNISNDSNYAGTNTATLTLNNVPSSCYGNTYTCLTNGNRGKLYFKIAFSNTWNSLNDSVWENPSNWSCGALPDANTDVVIRNGNVYLNSDVTIRTLTVAAGATFNIAPGRHLTVIH